MPKQTRSQNYPRIDDEDNQFVGFLDESALLPHVRKISPEELRAIIEKAIDYANRKSSRAILNIPEDAPDEMLQKLYEMQGQELFAYFIKYCGDPASTAHACLGQHYTKVAREQFRNRTLQKERMNSGWRYQSIAKDAAIDSQRFVAVSDVGALEADFIATIRLSDASRPVLSIYVSVKNRTNTLGGQDWPKAIRALEDVAKNDKNSTGPYICVFGIAMESGLRIIRREQKSHVPYSPNTEVWMSDFFWPFFANYTYPEIIRAVLSTLIETQRPDPSDIDIPDALFDSFGAVAHRHGLLDEKGNFHDAYALLKLFVRETKLIKPKNMGKGR
jgi:hypothetical protein